MKAPDLSNPSHENKLKENLEDNNKLTDSHETKNLTEENAAISQTESEAVIADEEPDNVSETKGKEENLNLSDSSYENKLKENLEDNNKLTDSHETENLTEENAAISQTESEEVIAEDKPDNVSETKGKEENLNLSNSSYENKLNENLEDNNKLTDSHETENLTEENAAISQTESEAVIAEEKPDNVSETKGKEENLNLSNSSYENKLNENLEDNNKLTDSHETKNLTEENAAISQTESEEVIAEDKPDNVSETKEKETAEKESELQKEPDYTLMEKSELKKRLSLLLENESLLAVKNKIEAIKLNFYKKHKKEVETAKKKFVAEGGVEEDFDFRTDELEVQVREMLQKFRDKKAELSRNIEQEKEENLKKKYQIIEDIKELVNRKEAFDKTFHEFRELQKKWHETGMVPQQALRNLWHNYHHHVENFYDYIKINKELRDLDLKKNMTSKIKLCEEAEKLLNESSIVKAFNTLQKYHDQWREIGPAPRDEKEDLWTRFKTATTIINRKHQEYYEDLKSEQKNNLGKKIAICEKAEEIANREIESHKEWNASSKEVIELQKEWRTIGFAPKKDNNGIYHRFRLACDLYFDKKRHFYMALKEKLNVNLEKKKELCAIAESLQDSQEWKETTDKLIAIQKEWKMIGSVPRKVSEELWVRFRAACDKFFNNKSEHFDHADTEQAENLKLKDALIEKVEGFELEEDNEINLNAICQFQKEWSQIGYVPYKKKDKIQEAFRKSINSLYDKMNMDSDNKEVQKFKSKIDAFLTKNNYEDKIIIERNKIMNKMRQLESDIALWENNIGFFSSSKNSSVVSEIQEKIERGKQNLANLSEKLKIIDGLVS